MVTKHEIETALNAHSLWASMRNGRYWVMRRNGATQLWKTRPAEFSIPVKAGLKACARIDHRSSVIDISKIELAANWRDYHFVISAIDPNTIPGKP
jgi:hypothetical protein